MEPNEIPNRNPKNIDPNSSEPKRKEESLDLESILLKRKDPPRADPPAGNVAQVLVTQAPPKPAAIMHKTEQVTPVAQAQEETSIKSLETYQGDIQDVIQKKNVSVVSIAAAESQRRAKSGTSQSPSSKTTGTRGLLFAIAGILIIAGVGSLFFIFKQQTVSVPVAPVAPIIFVDATQTISLPPTMSQSEALAVLKDARDHAAIPLGLMEQLILVQPTSNGSAQLMTGSSFVSFIAPNIPPELLRTIQPEYILGIHAYNKNQPFLILTVDSYTQAYSGMLSWENTMQQDFSPFFDQSATTTSATSTAITAKLLNTPFIDTIVENHDARVIKDGSGNIQFLWTFIDAHTIVVTTNGATLREIISRIYKPPVSTPQ